MAFGLTLINHNNIKFFLHLEGINWSFSFYFWGWVEFFTWVHHFLFLPNWEENMKENEIDKKKKKKYQITSLFHHSIFNNKGIIVI